MITENIGAIYLTKFGDLFINWCYELDKYAWFTLKFMSRNTNHNPNRFFDNFLPGILEKTERIQYVSPGIADRTINQQGALITWIDVHPTMSGSNPSFEHRKPLIDGESKPLWMPKYPINIYVYIP